MKLSVITINYNNVEGLKRTVSSVIEQTYKDFEYIVIDGGSDDGSLDYLLSKKPFFYYFVSEKDNGIYNALNKGIQKATGEYVICMNSGDCFYSSQTLENVIPYLDRGSDFLCGDTLIDNDSAVKHSYLREAPDTICFDFFRDNGLIHQSLFVKKKLHDDIGLYDENIQIVADMDFVLKAFSQQKSSYFKIPSVISRYDKTGVSSTNREKLFEEKKKVFIEKYDFFYRQNSVNRPSVKLDLKTVIKMMLPYGIWHYWQSRKKRNQ